MFVGIGFLLLAVAYATFVIVVLDQSYSGDGADGPLADVAQSSMGLSAAAGLLHSACQVLP
ncbi:hypothetical protein ACWGII_09085 [Streptomyces sp. NPDC054855]